LLVEWNDTAAPFPDGATLPELLARQAARAPDATAVVFRDAWLSYGELARRARVLGRHLRRRLDGAGGAAGGRDRVIGVCAERSVEMVVALLGVLEAGAAYLPLDPAYPRERLAFMLADAAAPLLLTQAAIAAGELGETLRGSGAAIILLDGGWAAIEAEDAAAGAEPAPFAAMPEDLAYVIYTSGSTGRPKGVMVPHRGIVNRLVWMQRRYRLDETDRVLQKTPFSFDVSVWELFWPLLAGARLVMAEPGRQGDPGYLAGALARCGVTTLHFVPSMLQLFVERAGAGSCPAVRRVIASGEALPPSLAARFAERFPGVELDNLYGPTEASVDVTAHRCCDERAATVPIGRPIENLRVSVLDREGRPEPVGVPGELHLAGVGLARGYLGRPALTAERFVPDPSAGRTVGGAGGRLYRTGDLCRALPDGEIEFLGRLDFQVKVRGLRIELGEIEAALASHPDVREVVVTARPDGAGELRLAAYLVAAGAPPSLGALRRHVGSTLPDYMVPSAFVFLEALPLSANGKVDRRGLPEPAAGGPERERGYVPPRTPMEAALAEVWAEVLRAERVGVHDNFFELGGHSLKATQVTTRIEEAFGVELPLRALFETPTVAGLAERVAELELETLGPDALAEALNEIDNLSEDELATLLGAGCS
ncbi:MAG TPA: amino acid adenylation domain-containing protein, partial [Thermoanaerobaculia bacterium]|nr:amino acid adenylation domain-containing protein [Thermoanaerobaculia bacterium]